MSSRRETSIFTLDGRTDCVPASSNIVERAQAQTPHLSPLSLRAFERDSPLDPIESKDHVGSSPIKRNLDKLFSTRNRNFASLTFGGSKKIAPSNNFFLSYMLRLPSKPNITISITTSASGLEQSKVTAERLQVSDRLGGDETS